MAYLLFFFSKKNHFTRISVQCLFVIIIMSGCHVFFLNFFLLMLLCWSSTTKYWRIRY